MLEKKKVKKIFFKICIAPTQPFLGAESSVTRITRQTGKLNEERSRTTTSRSQQPIRTESFSLPLLGFKLMIFGMLAHLSDHSAKSHPIPCCGLLRG
jgi:hypothetical protein